MATDNEQLTDAPESDTLSPIALTPEQIARARGDDVIEDDAADETPDEGEPDSAQEADPDPEDSASGEPPEGDEGGGEGGKEAAWITGAVRSEAAELGLDEDDLAGFASEVAFRRLAAKLYRTRPQDAADEPPVKDEKEEQSDAALLDVAKFEAADYDEDVLSLVRSHNAMVERLRALEPVVGQFREQQQATEQATAQAAYHRQLSAEFDKWADAREESVYGRSDSLGKEHVESRQRVFDAMLDYAELLHLRGEKVPEMSVLAERAERMEVGDKLAQARDAAIRKQAARRRPVLASGAKQSPKGSHAEALAFWERAQEESGVA